LFCKKPNERLDHGGHLSFLDGYYKYEIGSVKMFAPSSDFGAVDKLFSFIYKSLKSTGFDSPCLQALRIQMSPLAKKSFIASKTTLSSFLSQKPMQ
jgi:hypothetical protein